MDSSALNFGSNCWPRDILAEWRTRLGPLRQGRVALVRPAGPSGLPPASEPLPSGRGSIPLTRLSQRLWPGSPAVGRGGGFPSAKVFARFFHSAHGRNKRRGIRRPVRRWGPGGSGGNSPLASGFIGEGGYGFSQMVETLN